jgi:hypothetical protein
VGGPADVTEPGSARDHKRTFTEVEDSSSGSDSDETNLSRMRSFSERGDSVGPHVSFLAGMREETEQSKPKKIKIAGFPEQDIPDDIQSQRKMLQDFYTKWQKHKFGPSEESEDADTSTAATSLKLPIPIKTGLRNCDKLVTASDTVTSSFSQLSSKFLLFANAYPKLAPTCYKMAEYCFKMADIASRVLSASWKLNHGVTLSSMETAIGEVDSILTDLTPTFLKVYLQLENLYSEYVNYVTTEKAFERDPQFQEGYEYPPMETQISPFISVSSASVKKVLEIAEAITTIDHKPDPPEERQDSAQDSSEQRMEVEEPEQPSTLQRVREFVITFEEDMRSMCHHLSTFRVQVS